MRPTAFRFGAFQLDVSRQQVLGPDGDIALRPKTFELLRYLLECRGRVASKDELLTAVWPDVIVTEESITRCVSEIRKALGGDGTTLIKTLPKRGYLIDVPVIALESDACLGVGVPAVFIASPHHDDPSVSQPDAGARTSGAFDQGLAHGDRTARWIRARWIGLWRVGLLAASFVLLLAMTSFWIVRERRSVQTSVAAHVASAGCLPRAQLAVLQESSTARANQLIPAFSRQLADSVREHLSRIPQFRVVTSAQTERGAADRPTSSRAAVADDYRVHVRAPSDGPSQVELVQRATGVVLWSRTFDAKTEHRADHLADIAKEITYAIHVSVLRQEAASADEAAPTTSLLLAKGWASLIAPGPKNLGTALKRLQHALDADPTCSSAQIGTAGAKALLAMDFGIDDREFELGDARTLLERAMRSASDDFAVHFYLGVVHTAEENQRAALRHYDRAITLNPSFAPAYAYKARTLLRLGQAEDALKLIDYATAVSGSAVTRWPLWAGIASLQLGELGAARISFLKVLGTIPNSPFLHAALASSYALGNEWEDAYRHVTVLRDRTPNKSDEWRLTQFDLGPAMGSTSSRLRQGLLLALEKYPQ